MQVILGCALLPSAGHCLGRAPWSFSEADSSHQAYKAMSSVLYRLKGISKTRLMGLFQHHLSSVPKTEGMGHPNARTHNPVPALRS